MKKHDEMYDIENLLDNIDTTDIDLEQENETFIEASEEKRKLYVDKFDKSTSDLFRMIIEGELNLQPEYQRKFLWDNRMMSKFIESLLLSIPIPTIFLAENQDDTYEVIDGQQRLTTIFSFMKSKANNESLLKLPKYLGEIEELSLTGLETLNQYNNKKYSELEDARRKFNNVSLPIVIIKKDSSEDIKFDIFTRINSGSVKLNSQELLNVMYRGPLIEKLNDECNSKDVNDLFGNRPVLKRRFGYSAIFLRSKVIDNFIDIKNWKLKEVEIKHKDLINKSIKKYNGRLNVAIVEYLKEYRNDINEAEKLRRFISETTRKVLMVFGEDAFIRVNKKGSTSVNSTIAELKIVVLSRFDMSTIEKNKESIKESFEKFILENDQNMFIRATNNSTNVENRYKWGLELNNILVGK